MEKKFLLCDIEVKGQIAQKIIDEEILKSLPYSKKDSSNPNRTKYNYVLIPYINEYDTTVYENILTKEEFEGHLLDPLNKVNNIIRKELCKIFYPLKDQSFYLRPILSNLDFSSFAITYTDGSKTQKTDGAGYGVVKLKTPEDGQEVLEENYLTFDNYSYETIYGGTIGEGTNNIGEMTAIKEAIIHKDDKPLQIIMADSIYAIKSYREYIYNWKNNGYMTSSKKPIKNKELIIETQSLIENSNSVFLFCWVKGHEISYFNNLADRLAKIHTMGGDINEITSRKNNMDESEY